MRKILAVVAGTKGILIGALFGSHVEPASGLAESDRQIDADALQANHLATRDGQAGKAGEEGARLGGTSTSRSASWTLATGFRGHGYNEFGFACPGTFCWYVTGLTYKRDNQGNPVTANTLGIRSQGWDRCSQGSLYSLRIDSLWRYRTNQSSANAYDEGTFQNCTSFHQYRSQTSHYFQNSGTYSMNETHYITQTQ